MLGGDEQELSFTILQEFGVKIRVRLTSKENVIFLSVTSLVRWRCVSENSIKPQSRNSRFGRRSVKWKIKVADDALISFIEA